MRGFHRDLDALVARTPPQRDRYVDFLRVAAIGVVVVWHWSLSVLHWSGDHWAMPNPIAGVPGGWLATWLLQIMPVFFIVGGYANAAAWWSSRRDHRGFYRTRLRRLLVPVAVFVSVWVGFELVAHIVVSGYPGVLSYGLIVFTPLWFIAAYTWVVLLTPATATAHARAPWLTLALLAAAVTAADVGRFAAGVAALGWVNTALVWVLVHQLGYFYRDGTLARAGRWTAPALIGIGMAALVVLTAQDPYPRSMVATVGQERSNIFPTTVTIVAVALAQLGLIMLLRAPLTRWLRGRAAWKPVVAANSVVLTVFLWHMTALLVMLAALRWAGIELTPEPTARWWAQRPLWLLGPLPVLAALVAAFSRFERAGTAA